jgi:hypothetical protein
MKYHIQNYVKLMQNLDSAIIPFKKKKMAVSAVIHSRIANMTSTKYHPSTVSCTNMISHAP